MKKLEFLLLLSLMLMPSRYTSVKSTCAVLNEESTTLHFDFNQLSCTEIAAEDGQTYCMLSYPDCGSQDELGYPTLPIKYFTFFLPNSSADISLSIQTGNSSTHYLSHLLYPAQEPETTNGYEEETTFVQCDNTIYNSSAGFPSEKAIITSISCAGKGDKWVTVAVSPIVYYPLENKYVFYDDITLSVSYNIYSLAPQVGIDSLSSQLDIGLPFYEYSVITNRSLKDAFTRLISWRKQQGLNAGVVCIEDILQNPYVSQGDTVSSINDDAGKLRQYLQYAYKYGGAKSVLFGGKDSIIPIRYGYLNIPADLYFSELNSNWNIDGDSYYGESVEVTDFGAELSVGRILCSNTYEIYNYTDKLLRYELNPGNGDYNYLKKALYTQADQMQRDSMAVQISRQLHSIFPQDSIMSEYPSFNAPSTAFPKGCDIINAMNERYGFVSWFGHGHPFAITTCSDGVLNTPGNLYGIFSVANLELSLWNENGNDLGSLTNKYYPMIVYSLACTITPFDVLPPRYTGHPNIGQSFTLGKDYGGPAIIGNTRSGFLQPSFSLQQYFCQFIDSLSIGEAQNIAKTMLMTSTDRSWHVTYTSNIIGCPSIRIWTDIPSLFAANADYSSSGMTLSTNSVVDSVKIGIRDICVTDENPRSVVFYPSSGSISLNNTENSLITLTGKNCLPQIMPLNIQNTTMTGKHHLFVTDMKCGKNIRNGDIGNVIFNENADYTIETSGEFVLDKGTEIELGATLVVTPSDINY